MKAVREQHELLRLEVVGLAAEVAAVAAHAQSILPTEGRSRRCDEIRRRCRSFLRSADQVLSRDSRLLSRAEPFEAYEAFQELQRKLSILRTRPEQPTETRLGELV